MAEAKTGDAKAGEPRTIVIKKYANRRLYNTATSAYVTLEDLAQMVRVGQDFTVHDAKSGEDLTRQILTQIIFEEESRGEALLPVQFLRRLIGFYGGQMQSVLPSYLEMSLDSFAKQQEQLRGQFKQAFGGAPGAGLLDEAVRRNMQMFEQAMRMWPGFAAGMPAAASPSDDRPAAPSSAADDGLAEMRRQMDEMRAQLDRMAGDAKRK